LEELYFIKPKTFIGKNLMYRSGSGGKNLMLGYGAADSRGNSK
jgi:hypothetical protein